MQSLLDEIKEICLEYEISSLQRLIDSAEKLSTQKIIEIAILGQFKAGKSSFINSIAGRDILPTGVIPVTSAITRICYGEKEKALIQFNDDRSEEISVNGIDEFITESSNPKNTKNVSVTTIQIPELKDYKGLCFVDTPGIGSVFFQNTQTTEEWKAEATIAVICISAERPLSEFDLKLIKELDKFSYKQVCLLTKTDLFSQDQLTEIISFIKASFKREIGKEIDILTYSIFKNTELSQSVFYDKVCRNLIERYDKEVDKIYQHKVATLGSNCLNYLDIAYKASLKTDKEKEGLKEKIFEEKLNTQFIQRELHLLAENSKSQTRETIYTILEKHNEILLNELQDDFNVIFPKWKGNLDKLSTNYEDWLRSALKQKLKNIATQEQPNFSEVLKGINTHFGYYTKTLREKLSQNIFNVLEIELASDHWKPQLKPLKQPNISIYSAFDIHIDLLWFVIPMFLFRNIFKNYFLRQMHNEVDKNIHRLTSAITEIINIEIEKSKEHTLEYISNELSTVEKILSSEQSKSSLYKSAIMNLSTKMNDKN